MAGKMGNPISQWIMGFLNDMEELNKQFNGK